MLTTRTQYGALISEANPSELIDSRDGAEQIDQYAKWLVRVLSEGSTPECVDLDRSRRERIVAVALCVPNFSSYTTAPDLRDVRAEYLIAGRDEENGSPHPPSPPADDGDPDLGRVINEFMLSPKSGHIPIFGIRSKFLEYGRIVTKSIFDLLDAGLSSLAVRVVRAKPETWSLPMEEIISKLVDTPPLSILNSSHLGWHLDQRLKIVLELNADKGFAMACERREADIRNGESKRVSFWETVFNRRCCGLRLLDTESVGLDLMEALIRLGLKETLRHACRARLGLAESLVMVPEEMRLFCKALEAPEVVDARLMDAILTGMSVEFKTSPRGGGIRALGEILITSDESRKFDLRQVFSLHFEHFQTYTFIDVVLDATKYSSCMFHTELSMLRAWRGEGRDFAGVRLADILISLRFYEPTSGYMREFVSCVRDEVIAHGATVDGGCLQVAAALQNSHGLMRLVMETLSSSSLEEHAQTLRPEAIERLAFSAVACADLDTYEFFEPFCAPQSFRRILSQSTRVDWDKDVRGRADEAALAIVARRDPDMFRRIESEAERGWLLERLCCAGFVKTVKHILSADGFNASDFSLDISEVARLFGKHEGVKACLERLLDRGFSPDSASAGHTGLHSAAFSGNDELARLLLHHGSNPRRRDDNNRTPLCYALRFFFFHGTVANTLFSRMRPFDEREAADYLRELFAFPAADEYGENVHDIVVHLCSSLLASASSPEAAGEVVFDHVKRARLGPRLRNAILGMNLQLSREFVLDTAGMASSLTENELTLFIDVLNASGFPASEVDLSLRALVMLASEMKPKMFRALVRWMEPRIERYSPEEFEGCLAHLRYTGFGSATVFEFVMNSAHLLRLASQRRLNIYQVINDRAVVDFSYRRRPTSCVEQILLAFGLMGVTRVAHTFKLHTTPEHAEELFVKGRLVARMRERNMHMPWNCWNLVVEFIVGRIPDELSLTSRGV